MGTEIQTQDFRKVTGRLSHMLSRNFPFTISANETKILSAGTFHRGKKEMRRTSRIFGWFYRCFLIILNLLKTVSIHIKKLV
jgi:hypothetical protein